MNKPVPERRDQGRAAAGFRRLRHPSGAAHAEGSLSLSRGALARAQRNVWRPSLPGLERATVVSAHDGERHARRRLSVERRPARLRPGADAAPASRSQRLRHRHDGVPVARRHGGAQSRIRRGALPRGQRLADPRLGREGSPPESRHRGAAGISGIRRARDRCARRAERGVPPGDHLAALERAARPAQILADLRGHRAQQSRARPASGRRARAAIPPAAPAGAPITCRSITPSAPAFPAMSSA